MRFIRYVYPALVLLMASTGCHGRASGPNDPASGANDRAGAPDAVAQSPGPTVQPPGAAAQSPRIADSLAQKAMNTYIGHLGDGLVTVVINYISGDVASGYTVQRGRRRNFNGSVQLRGAALDFQLEETGEQPEKFEIALDTTGWKMTGRASEDKVWRQLTAGQKPADDAAHFQDMWVANMDNYGDSILTFEADGLCDFTFYQRPWDSTSQSLTIKGNYERLAGAIEGFRVEWEDNSHLTPVNAELKMQKDKLTGCGLKLLPFKAPW